MANLKKSSTAAPADLHTVKFVTHGSPHPSQWQVFVDGVEISRHVRRIEIAAGVNSPATVTLELVGKMDLPDEIKGMVYLTAPEGTE